VHDSYNETFNDKPILLDSGYDHTLRRSVGLELTSQGLRTTEDGGRYGSPELLPNTIAEAVGQLPGSPQAEDLQLSLPKH
jgi:hypothetical protein